MNKMTYANFHGVVNMFLSRAFVKSALNEFRTRFRSAGFS